MKKIFTFSLLLILSFNIFSQSSDSIDIKKPDKLPLWTLFVPGASSYYQHKYVEGTLFTTLELGGFFLAVKYDKELKSKSSSPYYNYPKAIGFQAFNIEKLANFKNHLEQVKYRHPDFKYHDISEKDLYLAPFKKENIFTPITGVMVLLAGVTLGVNMSIQEHGISDVKQMSFMNRYVDRNQALAFYCPLGFAQGWGAGVVEEYRYRNWLMPLLDYKLGQRSGLILSSLTFGASHATNYIFDKNADYKLAITQVLSTSLGGLVYGWDVQKRNYNIGPAVAAHMWFDTILLVGSFLINPKNNYLGVDLKYTL